MGPRLPGRHCPEGWTLYKEFGPLLEGTPRQPLISTITTGSTSSTRLGLGSNIPIWDGSGPTPSSP